MNRRKAYYRQGEKEILDRAKLHITQVIKTSLATRVRLKQKFAAGFLGTSQAQISRIETENVSSLTFNQLFRLLARLEPNFQILIAAPA